MPIKIASWNVEGRLGGHTPEGRGTARHILEGIAALNADVLVLPEAYLDRLVPEAEERLRGLGYEIQGTPHGDKGRENAKYLNGTMHMLLLSRLPVEQVERIRPGDVRNLLVCYITDPESGKKLRIVATHLDDRFEAARLAQVEDLVKRLKKNPMPTVMLGDFNAMWPEGRARLVGSSVVRSLARLVPHEDGRSVAVRAADMATGTTLKRLAAGLGLRGADPRRRPTVTPKQLGLLFLPSIRLMQIDHILVSKEITVRGFKVGKDGGSDHRAISAELTVDTLLVPEENKNNKREGK